MMTMLLFSNFDLPGIAGLVLTFLFFIGVILIGGLTWTITKVSEFGFKNWAKSFTISGLVAIAFQILLALPAFIISFDLVNLIKTFLIERFSVYPHDAYHQADFLFGLVWFAANLVFLLSATIFIRKVIVKDRPVIENQT